MSHYKIEFNILKQTSNSQTLVACNYRIPNGLPGPSPPLALNGPTLSDPTLCSPMDFSCRAVSGVVPDWRPRHGPMADFSGRAGTAPKTAQWAASWPGTIQAAQQAEPPVAQARRLRRLELCPHAGGCAAADVEGGDGTGRSFAHG
jgi:hypothetical protein